MGKLCSSTESSPPYPPLPHHFNDTHGFQLLYRASKGSIERAFAPALEKNGDDTLFVLQMGWSPDCGGFNVHEIQINAPVKWGDSAGATTPIEYVNESRMYVRLPARPGYFGSETCTSGIEKIGTIDTVCPIL